MKVRKEWQEFVIKVFNAGREFEKRNGHANNPLDFLEENIDEIKKLQKIFPIVITPDMVYFKDECTFAYCPNPNICKLKDECTQPLT